MATTVSTRHVQEDVVTALRQTKEKHGEIPGHPILVTQDGVILDGTHRKQAGFKSTLQVRVKDKVDFWEKRWALVMAQRTATQLEQAEIVTNLCEALQASGMPITEIARHVVKSELYDLGSRYTESYIYRMIPNRFKDPEKMALAELSSAARREDKFTAGKNFEIANDDPVQQVEMGTCDHCGFKGPWIAHHITES